MKKAILLIALVVLSGCEKPVDQWERSSAFDLADSKIKGLQDCKYYEVLTGDRVLRVIRCPNSSVSTTYAEGKTQTSTFAIDGDEVEAP